MIRGKIRIGIAGYGNLARGLEYAAAQNEDMEILYIFTRRSPGAISPVTEGARVFNISEIEQFTNEIDVLALCGGSASDLPEQTPRFARLFNVVDSFDTHAKIPEHFAKVDCAARAGGKTAVISAGWDPGLFSLNRLIAESVLPVGKNYTFWGEGLSQGHSDAIRRIAGVADARQYTIPVKSALDTIRSGEAPEFQTRQKHTRKCFVVPKEGADIKEIERRIVTMPHYFADYDTEVNFISQDELDANHASMRHGGIVIHSGMTGMDKRHNHIIEYSLKLDSNPEFTASAVAVSARAAYRLSREGFAGCKTIFDIPPSYYSAKSKEYLMSLL